MFSLEKYTHNFLWLLFVSFKFFGVCLGSLGNFKILDEESAIVSMMVS